MRSLCLLLMFTAALSHADEKDPCDPELVPVPSAQTPEGCEMAIKPFTSTPPYDRCTTTPWFHATSAAKYTCLKDVLEKTLDTRLLSLKKKDPKQYKREMALQKDFNKAIETFCEEVWGGGSAAAFNVNGCHSNFHVYRYHQALQIEKGELTLGTEKPKKPRPEFNAFAKGLCSLPKEAWRAGPPPSKTCPAAVVAGMESQGLLKSPGDY